MAASDFSKKHDKVITLDHVIISVSMRHLGLCRSYAEDIKDDFFNKVNTCLNLDQLSVNSEAKYNQFNQKIILGEIEFDFTYADIVMSDNDLAEKIRNKKFGFFNIDLIKYFRHTYLNRDRIKILKKYNKLASICMDNILINRQKNIDTIENAANILIQLRKTQPQPYPQPQPVYP